MLKKAIIAGIVFGLSTASAFAGDYTSDGKNVYYNGKKIGNITSAFGGSKGLCEHRSSGSVQVYSQKKDAIQSIIRECRTY